MCQGGGVMGEWGGGGGGVMGEWGGGGVMICIPLISLSPLDN